MNQAEGKWTRERIKRFRLRRQWTQQELAVRVGVSLSAVARWERGGSVPSRLASDKLDELNDREVA